MANSYVNFEVSPDVVAKTYEALGSAKKDGTVRKGVNEVTKSVERKLASFVVIAGDVDPPEVVIHLPKLCEQNKIPYTYVPSKTELGKAIMGSTVACAAAAVESQGSAASAIKEIISKVSGVSAKAEKKEQHAPAAEAAAPKAEAPKEKKPKAEKKEQ